MILSDYLISKFEYLWEKANKSSRNLNILRYIFGIGSVGYLLILLFFGFDEIKTIPLSSIVKGFLPSVFLYLVSLILQFFAWMFIFYGNIKFRAYDIYIFSISVLLRRLPGGFWHWAGRSTLYNKFNNVSFKNTTISNFIEWISLLMVGFGTYFLLKRSYVSIGFFIIVYCICKKWFDKNNSIKKINYFLPLILLILYFGSWMIGGLILSINGNVLINGSEISTMRYLQSWFLSGSISMIIFFLPAGFGIREISLSVLLKPYLGLSFSVLLAVIIRIIFILSELIWGFLGYIFFRKSKNNDKLSLQDDTKDDFKAN
ncbi:MAG: hypothetical protein ACYDH1_01185 [Anaerolineaceae bacterium]